jgi:hypothetical protein
MVLERSKRGYADTDTFIDRRIDEVMQIGR